VPDIYLGT